jgi:hypothetical protein
MLTPLLEKQLEVAVLPIAHQNSGASQVYTHGTLERVRRAYMITCGALF